LSPPDSLPPLPAEPRPGRYRHYKGNEYRVLGLARHSETLEALVVYQALHGERGWWVRPAAMFSETIQDASGARVPRFEFVGE
jgi:cyclomaltodextrinase